LTRVKRGVPAHHRHKKVLALTKGQRATRHTLYRRAHEAMMHSLQYAYEHRRERKGDMRRIWIARINASTRAAGMTYGRFIEGLKKANIMINRQRLSDLAITDPATFGLLVEKAKQQVQTA